MLMYPFSCVVNSRKLPPILSVLFCFLARIMRHVMISTFGFFVYPVGNLQKLEKKKKKIYIYIDIRVCSFKQASREISLKKYLVSN